MFDYNMTRTAIDHYNRILECNGSDKKLVITEVKQLYGELIDAGLLVITKDNKLVLSDAMNI